MDENGEAGRAQLSRRLRDREEGRPRRSPTSRPTATSTTPSSCTRRRQGKPFPRLHALRPHRRPGDQPRTPGQKECRFFESLRRGRGRLRVDLPREDVGAKGYKEVSLASSKIGSQKARGTSVGEVDAQDHRRRSPTKGAGSGAGAEGEPAAPGVQDLVRYIYDEATNALTSTVAAKITANGIETPLGILTVGQIEKGEAILEELYDLFKSKPRNQHERDGAAVRRVLHGHPAPHRPHARRRRGRRHRLAGDVRAEAGDPAAHEGHAAGQRRRGQRPVRRRGRRRSTRRSSCQIELARARGTAEFKETGGVRRQEPGQVEDASR